MNDNPPSIEFVLEQDNQSTGSAFLVALLDQLNRDQAWQPFSDHFDLKMKTVVYSPLQKLQTLCASIFVGCQYNKDINTTLVPDVVAADLLGMQRFPDQSQVNLLLTRLGSTQLQQLEQVHAAHLRQFAAQLDQPGADELVVVDIDQCGLIANGKSYELACKGYFPDHRGEQGYQLSAAFVAGAKLTLALRLDPGNSECKAEFKTMVELCQQRLPNATAQARLLIRADAGYGTAKMMRWLRTQPVKFLIKKQSSKPAAWVLRAQGGWQAVSGRADVLATELRQVKGERRILYQMTTAEGGQEYCILLSNLGRGQFTPSDLWWLYGERQSIEAFFKLARNTYGMSNLRSRSFNAIYGFLWIVFISHNLLKWEQQRLFGRDELAEMGICELVSKLGRVVARRVRTASGWRVELPGLNRLARRLVEALHPTCVQLDLGLNLRLYET